MNTKNRIVSLLGAGMLAMAALAPSFAGAESRGVATGTVPTRPRSAGFCSALSQRASSMKQQLSDMASKLEQRKTERESNLQDKWNNYLNGIKNKEDGQDQRLAAESQKLNDNATSTAEQAAVAAFTQSMRVALTARRTAVATALDTFHKGVVAVASSKDSNVANALKSASNALDSAIQKAQADCTAGKSAQTVRTQLMSVMQSLQSSFASARQKDDMSSEMKQLVAAKNAAIKKAQDDFKAAVIAARDALKAALGK